MAHFSSFGPIESSKILTDSSLKRSRGVGFLQFAQHQHALAAIAAMDGQVIVEDGTQQQQQQEQPIKTLVVKFATPKAANADRAATPKAIKPVQPTHSPRTPRKQLTVPSSPTASSASSTTSSASSTASSTASSNASSSSSADHNLYIAGFPLSYTREDVSHLLSSFGPLVSLRLLPPSPGANICDRKGEKRGGVAFARFVSIEDGDRCIAAMDGQPIEGGHRCLQVRYANRGGRMHAHQASVALDGAVGAVDYSAYAALCNLTSPYASCDYPNPLLLNPGYGYTTAADMISPTYASYPYTVVDPYTGSFYYPSAAVSPMASSASPPVALTSPTSYSTFSFSSPTTAIPLPTTPSHATAASTASGLASSLSTGTPTPTYTHFPAHLSLFFCHLPLHWSEANLLTFCAPYGHLTSARIVRDRDGASRGYGFVAFAQSENAARAREALDGRKVDGRLVKVQWKDGRASRAGSSGLVLPDGLAVEAMYGGLVSPTAAGLMGLAVLA